MSVDLTRQSADSDIFTDPEALVRSLTNAQGKKRTHARTGVCMCTYTLVLLLPYIIMLVHVQILVYLHLLHQYIHIYINIHTRTYTHLHIHTPTYTHTLAYRHHAGHAEEAEEGQRGHAALLQHTRSVDFGSGLAEQGRSKRRGQRCVILCVVSVVIYMSRVSVYYLCTRCNVYCRLRSCASSRARHQCPSWISMRTSMLTSMHTSIYV